MIAVPAYPPDPRRLARTMPRLDAIIQAAHRSSELTRNLLAFGRRGKNIVQAVDLSAVTRDVPTSRPTR